LERGVGRGETNAFDHGLEFIRSAMFLAVLLAFRDLSLAFGDSGWSEQKHLNLKNLLCRKKTQEGGTRKEKR